MVQIESLVNKVFNPFFLAGANFTAFGSCLAIGIMTDSPWVIAGSFGFFIGGASIGALAIANKWINEKEEEKQEPIQEAKEVVVHGNKTTNYPIQTGIEL